MTLSKAAAQPPFPDTAYYLGFAYFKHGDLADAEKWLKKAARLNPRDARVLYQLGFVYRKRGTKRKQRKPWRLLRNCAGATTVTLVKTECGKKLDQGPRDEARSFCEQLYAPDDAARLTALGTIYAQHRDLEAALKPFRRAVELEPQSPQMQYNLALTYFQLNQFEQARISLAHVIERWPDVFQLNALYGAVLAKLGEDVPAYQALHHAQQLNPQDSHTTDLLYQVSLTLARECLSGRQYVQFAALSRRSDKTASSKPAPHRSMAEIYTLTNHPREAAAELQEADRLSKNPAD